ncbi:PHB depolymerase family esterase [Paracoccus aminovorans]|uniref:PHB depolymerase family esterase n=1 Tax=Paracoccus aminovorans TaxID=34004 RepID=UPI00396F4F9A
MICCRALLLTQDSRLSSTAAFVPGLSAGGAVAVILARAYPDVFAAVGAHTGLSCGISRYVVRAANLALGDKQQSPATAAL